MIPTTGRENLVEEAQNDCMCVILFDVLEYINLVTFEAATSLGTSKRSQSEAKAGSCTNPI